MYNNGLHGFTQRVLSTHMGNTYPREITTTETIPGFRGLGFGGFWGLGFTWTPKVCTIMAFWAII